MGFYAVIYMNGTQTTYKQDLYQWTKNQAILLRNKEFNKLDIDNIIEEIESLGTSQKSAVRSHMKNLLMHLLKIKYQPDRHTSSWDSSIINSKCEISVLLEENPSLKRELPTILDKAYINARLKAAIETEIDVEYFPKECPWKLEEVLKEEDK